MGQQASMLLTLMQQKHKRGGEIFSTPLLMGGFGSLAVEFSAASRKM